MKKFVGLLILILSLFSATQAHASFTKTTVEWASKVYIDGNFKLPPTQECMAKVVWFEARGESYLGKKLVANVVRNRTTFGKPFATNICSVVYQKSQFSWTLENNKKAASFRSIVTKNKKTDRKNIEQVLKIVFFQTVFDEKLVTKATHFTSEKPRFKSAKYLGKVGGHHFLMYLGNPK